jgi:hypothetical protein
MKTKTFLVADGETTGVGSRAYLFDFAYTIATRREVLCERAFLIRDIITNPAIMLGAYYNESWRAMMGGKIFSDYVPMLESGEARLFYWREVVEILRDDMRRYGVDVFAAYNLGFDMRAIASTNALLENRDKVLPYRPDLLCLWQFACDVLCNTAMYHRVARESGWVSDAGNIRTNAEKVYAYLTQQLDFVERHTALDDAQIETEILQRLLAKKKTIPYNVLDHMPWKKAQQLGV